MFVPFLIWTMVIFTVGPLHNEGGAQAIQDKGIKQATVDAWHERDAAKHKANTFYNQ